MEEQKSRSKQDMKRTQISLGGGDGIGGVVVLGGAVAIAGLIAVFTFKNRRRKDADNNPRNPSDVSKESKNNKREEEGSEGLRFIPQTSYYGSWLTRHGTPQTSVTQIDDPCETLVSAKSLIMEEKPRNEISEENEDSLSGQQEIVICDYSTLESVDSCDDCGVVGKCSLPVPESPILIEETIVKNDSGMEENNSISIKTIEDEKADEAFVIVHAEDKAEHEKSTTQSDEEESDEESLLVYKEDKAEHEKSATQSDDEESDEESLLFYKEDKAEHEKSATQSDEDEEEQEEERDDWEGGIVEEGKESSEGTTGDSSMESNTEAIWPAELIVDSSQELEQTDFTFQNAIEKTEEEEDEPAKLVKLDYFNSKENGYALKYEAAEEPTMIWKETHKPVKVNNQPARSSKLGIWIYSIILLLLLLLLAFKDQKAVPTPAKS